MFFKDATTLSLAAFSPTTKDAALIITAFSVVPIEDECPYVVVAPFQKSVDCNELGKNLFFLIKG